MVAQNYFEGFEHLHVKLEDVSINTFVGGEGEEAILLLHGHPENYLISRDIAPVLAQKYRIVATDLRGYGDSSKPKGLEDHPLFQTRDGKGSSLRYGKTWHSKISCRWA